MSRRVQDETVRVSKALSNILRHKADKVGVELDAGKSFGSFCLLVPFVLMTFLVFLSIHSGGYATVAAILRLPAFQGVSLDTIKQV